MYNAFQHIVDPFCDLHAPGFIDSHKAVTVMEDPSRPVHLMGAREAQWVQMHTTKAILAQSLLH